MLKENLNNQQRATNNCAGAERPIITDGLIVGLCGHCAFPGSGICGLGDLLLKPSVEGGRPGNGVRSCFSFKGRIFTTEGTEDHRGGDVDDGPNA